MKTEFQSAAANPDSAAIFAAALSLWQVSQKHAESENKDISECFNGMDQFMREVMRIASQFETWACQHLDFSETNDVWPYFLEDKFGETCLTILPLISLAQFDDTDCLRVAMSLNLPIILDDKLPIPIDLTAPNPVGGAAFAAFRIQTVRNAFEDNEPTPFIASDEPFDGEFDCPYFSLYGVDESGKFEHIADRRTYAEALLLARKLAPGISFPSSPTFTTGHENTNPAF